MRIIFVTGIHGVGKTFLCNKLSAALELPFLVASELIKQARGQNTAPSTLNSEVDRNAELFKSEILTQNSKYDAVIVDGHTVLLTENGTPHPVALEVFKDLPITVFLILFCEANVISTRLQQRGLMLSAERITEFQNQELSHSLRIAGQLCADVVAAHSSEPVDSVVKRLRHTRMWQANYD